MMGQHNAIINFDAQIRLQDWGDRWAAYVEPPGMTVYGATEHAVRERVDETLKFFVQAVVNEVGLARFRRYLDAHGVKNSVIEIGGHPTSARHTLPVSLPVEVAASV